MDFFLVERQRDKPTAKNISLQAWVPQGDHTVVQHSPAHQLGFLDLLDLIQCQDSLRIGWFRKGRRQRETRRERTGRKFNKKETLVERNGWTQ